MHRESSDVTFSPPRIPIEKEAKQLDKKSAHSKKTATSTQKTGGSSPSWENVGSATDEMVRRWVDIMEKNVPTTDLLDIADQVRVKQPKGRQFAAQYS